MLQNINRFVRSGPEQAIMRTIAPHGYLHTFEFNEIRAKKAEEEFVENGLGEASRSSRTRACDVFLLWHAAVLFSDRGPEAQR